MVQSRTEPSGKQEWTKWRDWQLTDLHSQPPGLALSRRTVSPEIASLPGVWLTLIHFNFLPPHDWNIHGRSWIIPWISQIASWATDFTILNRTQYFRSALQEMTRRIHQESVCQFQTTAELWRGRMEGGGERWKSRKGEREEGWSWVELGGVN